MAEVQEIAIATIQRGERIRQDLGDIPSLAASIAKIGLLHPIVLDPQLKLIVGGRRLEAYRQLGRTRIPAMIAQSFTDIEQALYAERDENIERKAWTPSEAVAMANVLELWERAEAQARMREGQQRGGARGGRPRKDVQKTSGQNLTRGSRDNTTRSKARAAKTVGISRVTLAKAQEVVKAAQADPERYGDLVTKMDTTGKVDGAHRLLRKRQQVAHLRAREQPTAAFDGTYDVIVLDPPWPVAVQGREARPQQVGLPYTTMTVAEIQALHLPMAQDCHVWLWTTPHFLLDAGRCLDAWQLRFVCCFAWCKPGGMQPMDLPQFNCEFVLYARQGHPTFVETRAFPMWFQAPRGRHSAKPAFFYDLVRRVTAGRRLDMFNRRPIPGFERWGNEVATEA
jgi:N6-adenosine-specific RNA methylase IME4/ParB-like chromosome segregation protein Spo0J